MSKLYWIPELVLGSFPIIHREQKHMVPVGLSLVNRLI